MNARKMTARNLTIGTLAVITALGLAADSDASSSRRTHSGRATAVRTTAEAIAALTPVGAASGWGRIKVEEKTRGAWSKRQVEIDLFGLEPATRHTIEIDGVEVGTVKTDGAGWASLELESPDDDHPPVPAGLPAIADLESAMVQDSSGAFVLEGSFLALDADDDGGPMGAMHKEKIALVDTRTGGLANGIAKVEREAGEQEFKTRATGLMSGESYEVHVDGFVAGMVIADAIGQAELELEHPDDSNPLPMELRPIEDLRLVEWVDEGGDVVLTGSFTGVSSDDDADEDEDGEDEFKGGITELLSDGFTLQTASRLLTVMVTGDTTYEGVTGLDGLFVGDIVEVHGPLTGLEVQASHIELEDGDDDSGDDDSSDSSGDDDSGDDDGDDDDDDDDGDDDDDDDDDSGGPGRG